LEEVRYLKDISRKHTSPENKVSIKSNGQKAVIIYFYDYDANGHDFGSTIASFNDDKYESDLKNAYSTFERKIKENHIDYLDLYSIPIARVRSRTASLYGGESYETYKLFKLHGSINWYYSAAKEKTTEQIYLSTGSEEEKRVLKDLVPVIIPPVLDKTGFFKHSTIKSMWNEAKNLLKEAKKVYIIGYSIPPTDLTVKFMLPSYIPEDCEVILVNKDEGRKEYFEEVFHKQFIKEKLNEDFIRNDDGIFEDFVKSIIR